MGNSQPLLGDLTVVSNQAVTILEHSVDVAGCQLLHRNKSLQPSRMCLLIPFDEGPSGRFKLLHIGASD